jgi:hypothetical protein
MRAGEAHDSANQAGGTGIRISFVSETGGKSRNGMRTDERKIAAVSINPLC